MAKKKKLLWHLFFSFVLITVLSLAAAIVFASRSIRAMMLQDARSDLEARAQIFSIQVSVYLDPLDSGAVDVLCKRIAEISSSRFTVVLPSGKVVGDSETEPAGMDNHLDRPEIIEALNGTPGVSTRYSPSTGRNMMYVAVPLRKQSRTLAVVRTSRGVETMEKALKTMQTRMALGGVVIAALASILSLWDSRRIRRPIAEIRQGAEAISRGEFQVRLPASDLEEVAGLSSSMNHMARELRQRMNTMEAQRNELEAVLSSMVEGVFGVDLEEHIMGMNEAASRILGCNANQAKGRSIQEAVRNPSLQRFIKKALSRGVPLEEDILFYGKEEQLLNAHATPLQAAEGGHSGVLIVLHDVTKLRKLENIRKDFVANASHEIKTPITAIKGFVETLMEGTAENPQETERFLGIIQKHVERLEAIVEDLLALSRIEKEAEMEEIPLKVLPVREVLMAALQACQKKASDKGIPVQLNCGEDLKVRVNPTLLEQAVVNLLDNAIAYSETARPVRVTAEEGENEILIHVRDEGCGIEKVHLERLFERFYRVDRARSRKLGGTGLGLSIVKHILEAHGGCVTVKSEPGKGSTFTLHLPRAAGDS
jgi:two-component system phosphate regulon sensor histidine kinase PhoR